jgi:uncharacterized membrane protein YoaK (UPF0700 family)
MSVPFDFNGGMLVPFFGFAVAFALCDWLRRYCWVRPPCLLLLVLVIARIIWTVQGFQAAPEDWSGIGLIILVMFVVAPTWLGALVGADVGRRHHAKANPNLAPPR